MPRGNAVRVRRIVDGGQRPVTIRWSRTSPVTSVGGESDLSEKFVLGSKGRRTVPVTFKTIIPTMMD
jgi:hypothetical protein